MHTDTLIAREWNITERVLKNFPLVAVRFEARKYEVVLQTAFEHKKKRQIRGAVQFRRLFTFFWQPKSLLNFYSQKCFPILKLHENLNYEWFVVTNFWKSQIEVFCWKHEILSKTIFLSFKALSFQNVLKINHHRCCWCFKFQKLFSFRFYCVVKDVNSNSEPQKFIFLKTKKSKIEKEPFYMSGYLATITRNRTILLRQIQLKY